jgi:CRP/FNR family transcriptional regulator, cyclic AMP receptor protein
VEQPVELTTTKRVAEVLSQVDFLQKLDPNVYFELANDLRTVHLRRGQAVFSQGDPADGLRIVITGKVKVCSHSRDGREKLMEIRGPGDVLGAVSMLDAGPRTATAMAITDLCVAIVDDDTLRRWMVDRPQITERLLRLMAGRLRSINNHLLDVVFEDVPGRVAKELLHLAHRFGTQQGNLWQVRHDLTQKEIAQLVGATRESVNKALCDFVHRGWITTDGKSTVIHHPELLARRAG